MTLRKNLASVRRAPGSIILSVKLRADIKNQTVTRALGYDINYHLTAQGGDHDRLDGMHTVLCLIKDD